MQPDATDNAGGTDNAGTASEVDGSDNASTPSDAATPSDAGGALARTGAEVVPAALVAVTVVAGMALLLVMRRRRA